jgi:hypothetical protein
MCSSDCEGWDDEEDVEGGEEEGEGGYVVHLAEFLSCIPRSIQGMDPYLRR